MRRGITLDLRLRAKRNDGTRGPLYAGRWLERLEWYPRAVKTETVSGPFNAEARWNGLGGYLFRDHDELFEALMELFR